MFKEIILPLLVSFFAGAAGALGIGGGGVLLLWLTVFAHIEQLRAQGMNLIFFIPIALTALVMHGKNRLIEWKATLVCALCGLAGAWAGVWLADFIGDEILRKLFGFLLAYVGLSELFKPLPAKKPAPEAE